MRLVLSIVAIGLMTISAKQVYELWPAEKWKLSLSDSSETLLIKPGETLTSTDPRMREEKQPRHYIKVHTHFENIDFDNEEVTFSLEASIETIWIGWITNDYPDAELWFRLSRMVPEGVDMTKKIAGSYEDDASDLVWDLGTYTQKFDTNASSFPLDEIFQVAQYSMVVMSSPDRGLPEDARAVYTSWTYSTAPRTIGWTLEVEAIPNPRHDSRHSANLSFKRDANTITQAGIYLAALFCVVLSVAFFSVTHARKDGAHLEEVGGVVALALAIPAIRSLLPAPGFGISTLMDAGFLFLFSILIAAILLRIAIQIR
jgi:hypothetical protein